MGEFKQFYEDFKDFRQENRSDHSYILHKVDDLTERVVKVEMIQETFEKRSGFIVKLWCAIIGAIGVVIGGIVSMFTTKV